jgi:hypothetical protein
MVGCDRGYVFGADDAMFLGRRDDIGERMRKNVRHYDGEFRL